jgi:hypothetical protein
MTTHEHSPSKAHNGYIDGIHGLSCNDEFANDREYMAAYDIGRVDRYYAGQPSKYLNDPTSTWGLVEGQEVTLQKGSEIILTKKIGRVSKWLHKKVTVTISKVLLGRYASFKGGSDFSRDSFSPPVATQISWDLKSSSYPTQTSVENVLVQGKKL